MKEVLLTSSVLILVLTALRFFFRNSISRRLQYALWLLVGLRLLIPVSLLPSSPLSVMAGAEALSQRWEASAVQPAPETAVESADSGGTAFGLAELPDAQPSPVTDVPADTGAPLTVDAEASAAERTFAWTEIARWVWAAGAVVVLGWLLSVNLRFRRQLRKTREAVDVEGSPLPVYVTDAIVSPCLFGFFRPAVYLTPRALESDDSLRHVLTHELCHYRHGDHIWALLRSALLAIYWFDPLVWLAAALSRADSELACDEAVLRKLDTSERLAYGKTLVDMVAVRRTPTGILCAATTMTSGKRSLKERLGRIVRKPKVAIPAVVAVVLLASVCVACTFSGAQTVDAEPEETTDTSDTNDQTTAAEVTYTMAKVENGVETPINDPDGFLAGEIFFDAMVKSAAAPAVELPDTYYILRSTETPMEGGEATVREYQIFRLYDGVGPFDLGTPVMQHGDQYTAIDYELMARLDAAANPLSLPATTPDPKASAHQDVLIDYADDNMVIFHGFFGLFVYDRNAGAITHSLDLGAVLGTSQVYNTSDSYAEVAVSRDGRVLRLAARGNTVPLEAVWIDTASWTGGTGPWAELRQPFDGGKATVTTAQGETVSIDLGSGLIGEVQLVTEDGSHTLFTGTAATPTNLDDAIAAGVASWFRQNLTEDDYLTEAHWLLGTEESADGTITAYCQTQYMAFAGDETGIGDSTTGGAGPKVFTLQQDGNGALRVTQVWTPELGDGYVPSILEKFPSEIDTDASNYGHTPNGSAHIQSLIQSCWDQAIEYFHADMTDEISAAVDVLATALETEGVTLGDANTDVQRGLADGAFSDAYKTAVYCGDTTLRYAIPQLLSGTENAARQQVLEELLWAIHPGDVEGLTSPDLNGDPTFKDMVDYAKAMADEYGVEYFAGNRTASILLWNLGYSTATMPQYEEIDRLVEMICSTPSEASSTAAYFAMHPVETAILQSRSDATLKYCFYSFLRGDSDGLRGAVLWSLMDSILGGEAIGYDAADAQDYFDHWQGAILQTYEDNGEAYMRQYMPCGTILLECMGLLETEG